MNAPTPSTPEAGDGIPVEVVYALPDELHRLRLRVPPGTTVIEAIVRSGIRDLIPADAVDESRIGVFGRRCRPDRVLHAGDRVEIYRPLAVDPREMRRRRAG